MRLAAEHLHDAHHMEVTQHQTMFSSCSPEGVEDHGEEDELAEEGDDQGGGGDDLGEEEEEHGEGEEDGDAQSHLVYW